MGYSFVYITTGGRDEALAIGKALVEERLAACAKVLEGVRSIYRWRGAVHQADEAVVVLRTRSELVEALTARARALHSYECPCVIALPIEAGNAAYLDWLGAETRAADGV